MASNIQKKSTKSKLRAGGRLCGAKNCSNYALRNPGVSFFRFPSDEKRCQLWVANSRNEKLKNKTLQQLYSCHICAKHFEDSQFTHASKTRLNWNAVPTLIDVPNPPPLLNIQRKLPYDVEELRRKTIERILRKQAYQDQLCFQETPKVKIKETPIKDSNGKIAEGSNVGSSNNETSVIESSKKEYSDIIEQVKIEDCGVAEIDDSDTDLPEMGEPDTLLTNEECDILFKAYLTRNATEVANAVMTIGIILDIIKEKLNTEGVTAELDISESSVEVGDFSATTLSQSKNAVTEKAVEDSLTTEYFSCDKCQYRSKRRGDYNKHVLIHTDIRPYHCSLCSYKTTEKCRLNRHMKSKLHTGYPRVRRKKQRIVSYLIRCDRCDYKTEQTEDMMAHKYTHSQPTASTVPLLKYENASTTPLQQYDTSTVHRSHPSSTFTEQYRSISLNNPTSHSQQLNMEQQEQLGITHTVSSSETAEENQVITVLLQME